MRTRPRDKIVPYLKQKKVVSVEKPEPKKPEKQKLSQEANVLFAIQQTLELMLAKEGKAPVVTVNPPTVNMEPKITIENPKDGAWKKISVKV